MFLHFRHFIAVVAFLLLGIVGHAQPRCTVDERFELTGIVFRLTGDEAFVHSSPESYMTEIDDYFLKYKDHELIQFVKKVMYSKPMLSISLPMFFAGDIQITSHGIVWTKEWKTIYEMTDTLSYDFLWTKTELKEYLRLLNKFYKDTRFGQFYANHRTFYHDIEVEFQEIAAAIDTAWFSNFFGIPFEMDYIWLVPVNGNFNFSINRDDHTGKEHHNCAVSGIGIDTLGKPYFSQKVLRTLVHEICHNYNNPICQRHRAEFQSVCDSLFPYVQSVLNENYYGIPTAIMDEGFNRLCEFAYYKSKNLYSDSLLHEMATIEVFDGFFWFEDMLRHFDLFFLNRDKFHTFEDFFPVLKTFLERTTSLMAHYYCPKYDLLQPKVVATFPGNNTVVDTNLQAVTIQFSKPMQYVLFAASVEDTNITMIPIGKKYWFNDYIYVIELREKLKPHTKYGLHVPYFFADKIEYFGCTPYDLIFETR